MEVQNNVKATEVSTSKSQYNLHGIFKLGRRVGDRLLPSLVAEPIGSTA